VRVFNRHGVDKDERALAIEREEIERLAKDRDDERGDPRAQHLRPPQGHADRQGKPPPGPKGFKKGDHHRRLLAAVAGQWWQFAVATTKRHGEIEALKKQYDDVEEAPRQRFDDKVESCSAATNCRRA
jgi:DNA-directed RNA polymerase subunit beta